MILLAVRWYLKFGLSYRDLEKLLAERGIEVDHVTLYRWVQRFTPLLVDAARPCRHAVGNRWFTDETYVKVAGSWRYVYRAVDQHGQVIEVFVSQKRDSTAATRFITTAITGHGKPAEVTTDLAHLIEDEVADLVGLLCGQLDTFVDVGDGVFGLVDADRLLAAVGPLLLAAEAYEVLVDGAVAVLGVADDEAAPASPAVDGALQVVVVLALLVPGDVVGGQDLLNLLPGLRGDQRFVLSRVQHTPVADDARQSCGRDANRTSGRGVRRRS